MSANDIFCGECGFVSHTVSEVFITPGDTARIEPVPMTSATPMPKAEPVPEAEALPPVPSAEFVEPVPPVEFVEPVPDPIAAESAPVAASVAGSFDDDIESTRIVGRHQTGERFVLQFSTGESVTVYGSGLIGRNPHAEPGEHFDHVVRIVDVTRSVSKTHLEFGQESGAFWIKDRFSGNGTVLREPDERPVRCLPDHRHRVVRGSRVDMGEQFFVVS